MEQGRLGHLWPGCGMGEEEEELTGTDPVQGIFAGVVSLTLTMPTGGTVPMRGCLSRKCLCKQSSLHGPLEIQSTFPPCHVTEQ